jgi:hypothetical protein
LPGRSDSSPRLGNGRRFASALERRPRLGPDSFPALRFRRSNGAASFLVGQQSLAKRENRWRALPGRNRIVTGFLSDCRCILNGSCHPEVMNSLCSCCSTRRAKCRGQQGCRPLDLIRVKNDRKAQEGSQDGASQKKWSALRL